MLYIDRSFIQRLSSQLEGFTQKKTNLYNCRCPLCGDSQKKTYKMRGFLYEKKNNFRYMCHNCGAGMSLGNFIKEVNVSLYQEYVMEKWKQGKSAPAGIKEKDVPIKFDFAPKFSSKCSFDYGEKITDLSESHPARVYCEGRKLPMMDLLYYTDDFKSVVDKLKVTNNIPQKEKRIVIPFFDEKCDLIALQGRSLDPKSHMRYITIKVKDVPKIFGLDRVDPTKTVYVVEGPIDSLFVDNALAMAGSDIDKSYFKDFSDVVFVYDNEPRNKEIVKKIEQAIDNNFSVVIWPEKVRQKDINDMILSGIDITELQGILSKSTSKDLEAKLKIASWKRC